MSSYMPPPALPVEAATPRPRLAGEPPAANEANLAQLFRNRSRTYADALRWREPRAGAWLRSTYREHQQLVEHLMDGLDALGARPGDVVAILSGTRWEWMAADWAILGIGGVVTMVYASNTAATSAFILADAGARFAFVEDRLQYEKLARMRDRLPRLERVILFEDAAQVTDDPWVLSFADLQALGHRPPEQVEAFAAARAAAIQPDDRAAIVYTSGTTGEPKGVVHTHRTLLAQLAGVRAMLTTVRPGMSDLLFLPLSHVLGRLEHLFTFDQGCVTVVAPSLDRLAEDLRAARPDIVLSVPRIYEKAYAHIIDQVEEGSRLTRWIFHRAVRIGRAASQCRQQHRPLPLSLRARLAVADRLVFRKVREALGGRLQFAVTGGAPLDLDILEFFHAAGVLLLEGWGLTETGGAFTVNTVADYRLGTVGRPFPGHEVRLAPDGEVLVRGPCIFAGYHHKPEETAAAFDAEGWFYTGDVGELDGDGFLRIVDRKKDLIATAGGKKIAPQYVENLLKAIPTVSQACVYGDRRPYLVALLTLDAEPGARWAEQHGLAAHDLARLAVDPTYRAFLDASVAEVNGQLASYETVKAFDLLVEDFTVDNGLLTPTLKIRRKAVVERYRERFESLYHPVEHP